MQSIPVIFARNNSGISRAIRAVTWSNWSHVGIVSRCGNYVFESIGGHKVVLTPIDDFKARYDLTHQCYLPTRNADKSYDLALSKIGKEHDKGAVFGILLRSNLEDPDKWSCSEYVAYCIGFFRSELMWRITPECLWRISYDNPIEHAKIDCSCHCHIISAYGNK